MKNFSEHVHSLIIAVADMNARNSIQNCQKDGVSTSGIYFHWEVAFELIYITLNENGIGSVSAGIFF